MSSTAISKPTFEESLDEHLRAGYQILYIPTSEESRVEACIDAVAKKLKLGTITWDIFEAFDYEPLHAKRKEYRNPMNALEAIDQRDNDPFAKKNFAFVFRDLDDFTKDPMVRRRIRSLAEGNRLVNKRHTRPIIILSPTLDIHPKLRSSVTVLDFELPGEEDMLKQIDFIRSSIKSKNANRSDLDEGLRRDLASNLLGLTATEADNCLSRCLVRHGGFNPDMLRTVKEEKAAIVKKGEVLTYIPEDSVQSLDDIGGWDQYRSWLNRRKLAYLPEAREHKIDYPKGCTIIGLPGTGKSVVAKATSQILNLPAYILDIGSLFGSLVGESEQRTRDVLKQIDAQRGCVLVIDEADKALGNAHSSQGDSGVTRRVFGTILTWLAENQSKTFCIMTLNRTEGLPPELTRAGRFDAMFYTDLPNEAERRLIMEIHLRKRGVNLADLELDDNDWQEILKAAEGFVGSELEEAVKSARYLALEEAHNKGGAIHGNPSFDHLIEAINGTVPMTRRDPEGMNKIREYCKGKAQPVTTPTKKSRTRTRAVNVDRDS